MASQEKSELLCKLLPNDVQNVIRSGVVITNVVRCVEELVLNSIDAGATGVNVTINLDSFRIKVEDNGVGISREDLGVLGTRYMTSKCQSLADLANFNTYGFRGESLASIIEVSSAVEVISKTNTSGHAYRRKFKNGKAGDIQRVNDDVIKVHGCIAIIHGLLEKQPVRRQRIDKTTEVEEIKSCLESINLINPSVIITLRNDSTGALLIRTIVAESMLDHFKKICQLKQNVIEQRLIEVLFTQSVYDVSGFVSQNWHPTKSLQYVYINKRLVVKSKVNKMLSQKLAPLLGYNCSLSQQFSQTTALRAKFTKKISYRPVGPSEKFPIFVVNINCPPSQVDMIYEPSKTYVNFVSNEDLTELIATLLCQVEAEINLSKQMKAAPGDKKYLPQKQDIVTEKISMVTNQNNILGKRQNISVNDDSSNASKAVLGPEISDQDTNHVFHSRPAVPVKREATHQSDDGEVPEKKVCHNNIPTSMPQGELQSSRSSGVSDSTTNEIIHHLQDVGAIASQVNLGKIAQDEVLPTCHEEKKKKHQDNDPVRAQVPDNSQIKSTKWTRNSSTGSVLRNLFTAPSRRSKAKDDSNKIYRMGNINLEQNKEIMIRDAARSDLGGDDVEDDLVTHKWQENCLQECEKYFHAAPGEPMEVDQREDQDWNAPLREGSLKMPISNDNVVKINMWRKKAATNLPIPCQFSKDDLSRTIVIGNVDRKFIAAKITMRPTYDFDDMKETEMLVLFDQHAVHERICLERLIDASVEENANGERTIVSVDIYPPLQMSFTGSEVRVMESNKHAFGLIGLKFEIVGPFAVKFFAAPKCFAEKVAKEPMLTKDETAQRLLQSLVRDQVTYIMQTNGAVQILSSTIMNVLRSQACRGAIKFGDELSLDACVHLIDDLKTCQAPFQCAHGRPVLVPVLDLKDVK